MTNHALAVQNDSAVAAMVRASQALAEAKTISQTKHILDMSAAAEIYAKRQGLSEEAISVAHSIKIEALRQIGMMLKDAPKAKGEIRRGTKMEPRENDAPTLKELGLDKKTSSIAQKLAELPQSSFEQVREGNQTIAKAIAAVDSSKPEPKPAKPAPIVSDELASLRAEHAELIDAYNEQGRNVKEMMAELAVFEADDALAAATAENKQLRAQVEILTARINGAVNEAGEAKKAAERWQRKFQNLEKQVKANCAV